MKYWESQDPCFDMDIAFVPGGVLVDCFRYSGRRFVTFKETGNEDQWLEWLKEYNYVEKDTKDWE